MRYQADGATRKQNILMAAFPELIAYKFAQLSISKGLRHDMHVYVFLWQQNSCHRGRWPFHSGLSACWNLGREGYFDGDAPSARHCAA